MTPRFNYYRDYTSDFKLVKKIWVIITTKKIYEFDFFTICRYLRWKPYSTGILKGVFRHDLANEIRHSLKLLKDINAITHYEVVTVSNNNYLFDLKINNIDSIDSLIVSSRYYPLEGWPQRIDDDFLIKKKKYYDILNYEDILEKSTKSSYLDTANTFREVAINLWEGAYEKMKNRPLNITDFHQNKFIFLMDEGYIDLDNEGNFVDCQDERPIVFAGFSKSNLLGRVRNNKRLREYRKWHFANWADKQTDTGHYVAHSIWEVGHQSEVDLELNLFPQKSSLNRGHSEEGKRFRKMEDYCSSNPNTFLFVRPIFGDSSIRPFVIEYGILLPDLKLWVEQFTNV